MSLSPEEQIQKLDNEIKQLKARKKSIANKEKERAKKEKTRLLIQYGELVEKYLKCETAEQLESTLKQYKKKIQVEQRP